MIEESAKNALAVAVAGFMLLVGAGLVASLPWALWQSVVLMARREWLPLVYCVRSLVRRRVSVLSTFMGLTLVVFVLTAALMFAAGIRRTLTAAGDPRNAKILLKSVASEAQSFLSRPQVNLLSVLPDVAVGANGTPLVSPELLVLVWSRSAAEGDPEAGANLSLRGVSSTAFELHPVKSIRGQTFKTGQFEIVIGKSLEGKFQGATLGGRMALAGYEWHVVGIVDHGGTAYDSELWADLDKVREAFKRDASVVTLALRAEDSFAAIQNTLATTPQLSNLQVRREVEYWESVGERYVGLVKLLGGVIGSIFAFAAILAAMNTMSAQVSVRTRELGALRAIGFKRRAVLLALLVESMSFAIAAGAVGTAAASVLHGTALSLTSERTLTEVSYRLEFSGTIALVCIGAAAFIGYAGGLLPALQASRMRIVDAVRV